MNQTKQALPPNQLDFALDDGGAGAPHPSFENCYAIFSFYDDYQCLSRGEVFVMIQVDAGDLKFNIGPQKLLDVHSEVLKVTSDEYRERMAKDAEKVCKAIID